MTHIRKKTAVAAAIAAVALACAATAAQALLPASADGIRHSAAIVERVQWMEVCADGRPLLYFSAAAGDTALLGVTSSRDSALHRSRAAGCWLNRWAMVPSCGGRIMTVMGAAKGAPRVEADSTIIGLCRRSVERQLHTLKAQKTELDYYLRVHGVQDNGYQAIASLAERMRRAYADVQRAADIVDSLAAGRHRYSMRARTEYVALWHDGTGIQRLRLNTVAADARHNLLLLRTADESTPSGAKAQCVVPWQPDGGRDVRAAGFAGLGESGLECDTVSADVIPGHLQRAGRHDLPRLLAADGAPVYTARGRFIGLVSGDTIIGRRAIRRLLHK